MSDFDFQPPSIHRVTNVIADAQVFDNGGRKMACLHIVFCGNDGEQQEVEAFFTPDRVHQAVAIAAAINAVSGVVSEDDEEAA
jgi:hypothetical protein